MVNILKADGTLEPFDPKKLERSLSRAGAKALIQKRVIDHVLKEIKDGDTTEAIYTRAFEVLREERENKPAAARYSVKRAVQQFGPSGFPFERFVAEIFKTLGYTQVDTGVTLDGRCVTHEVDVVAQHGTHRMGAEVKFHNNLGTKTDVKDALYVRARFDDLEKAGSVTEPWLITNTRFTKNAIAYANCVDMRLLGWDYPHNKGLEVLIDKAHVHPVTAITSISNESKKQMLAKDVVLCRNVLPKLDALHEFGIPKDEHDTVRYEVEHLCG